MMIGEDVDNFRLKDQYGNLFDLYENLDKNVLLVFYPKDNSRICSKQLQNYQIREDLFLKRGIKVIGINIESIKSHKIFCDDKEIRFPILFDENKEISRKFKALNIFGFNKRKIVLVDKNRKIGLERDLPYYNFPTAEELCSGI
jgi:thioredoxin-dependent peroxiredoxin